MKVAVIGGHLSPALAVIEKLKDDEVFYIGRKYALEGDSALSLEYQEISKRNINFFDINTGRLQRKFTKHTLKSLSRVPLGFFKAYKLLKEIRPDVILGFGGYVQFPVVLAAKLLKISVVIHEQTLQIGAANKAASAIAKKICISFESSRIYFPQEKTFLTGNPIREEIIEINKNPKKENKIFTIYITGGSLGSHFINTLIESVAKNLSEKYFIIHQTGDSKEFEDFDRLIKLKNKKYVVKKFLSSEESAISLNMANLVIGRAGINTVTELIYLNKPALLIPIPFAQKNEQLKNAEFLKSLGLGEFLEQGSITPEVFLSKLSKMIENIDSYKLKGEILEDNAAEKIINIIKNV